MGGELGGAGGEAPQFRPRRTKGVRGGGASIFTSAQRTRVVRGGGAPGLQGGFARTSSTREL